MAVGSPGSPPPGQDPPPTPKRLPRPGRPVIGPQPDSQPLVVAEPADEFAAARQRAGATQSYVIAQAEHVKALAGIDARLKSLRAHIAAADAQLTNMAPMPRAAVAPSRS